MALTQEDWKAIVAAIVILVGANFGNFYNAASPDARADPFTGTDGKELKKEIREMIIHEVQEHRAQVTARFLRNERLFEEIGKEANRALINDERCREGLLAIKEEIKECQERLDYHFRNTHGYRNNQ